MSELVSIVVPTYQRAATLGATLESLIAQAHRPLEIVVVDDGSTDDTPAVLKAYAARHGDLIGCVRQDNAGQPAALNHGFRIARGDILGTLSSDDLLDPAAISKVAAPLIEDPSLDLSFPDNYAIDESDANVEQMFYRDFDLAQAVCDFECPVGVGTLIRRSVLDRAGPWDPSYRYCPDLEFWMRAGLLGLRTHHVREPLGMWRVHQGAISSIRSLEPARERIRLIEEFYATDGLPPEVLDVKAAAFRSAFIVAGAVCMPETDAAQRFGVIDGRAMKLLASASDSAARQLGELRMAMLEQAEAARVAVAAAERLHEDVASLHAEVAVRDAEITRLHAEVARRDELLGEGGRVCES